MKIFPLSIAFALRDEMERWCENAPTTAVQAASGKAGVPPADPGVSPGSPNVGPASNWKGSPRLVDLPGGTPGRAGETPALPGAKRRCAPCVPAVILLTACSILLSAATAKEITSNGLGGGRWSDTTTWRGGAVPGAEDEAVIGARDTVLFDRNDEEGPTCKQLILDPNSNFAFQSGLGKRTLTVNGSIEAFGSIKMHAPALTDDMEIRLASTVDTERLIKLGRGAALLMLGRPDLPEGKRNVRITVTAPPVSKGVPAQAELTAGDRTALDVQYAQLDNLAISATGIDNTGAQPNERCNFIGNLFSGYARLGLSSCDTPVIARNEFQAQKAATIRPSGIAVGSCPLAEIRGNHLTGAYAIAINVSSSEANVADNLIEGAIQGIVWHTGAAMLKHNTMRNCKTGLALRTVTGSAEDTTLDGCDLPLSAAAAKVQLTSVNITNPGKGPLMESTSSSVGLLNCNIKPEQIKSIRDAALPRIVGTEDPAVETLAFLVVGLKGTFPRGAQIEVRTSKPAAAIAPGAMDMNIRNSPARVRVDGSTPLPQSLTPLIVKAWLMDDDGKVVPAPEYTVNILELAAEPGAKPRVLKSVKVKPDETWFRPEPNDPKPTLEIQLP
jgi:hypothetical protein